MSIKGAWEASASRSMREGVRRFQTRDVFNSCLDLQKRVTKYAFDEEITLSAVMVDATQAWLDARDGLGDDAFGRLRSLSRGMSRVFLSS